MIHLLYVGILRHFRVNIHCLLIVLSIFSFGINVMALILAKISIVLLEHWNFWKSEMRI